MASYLNDPADSFGGRLAAFPRRFPAVKTWQVRRDWWGRNARVEVTLRRAAAQLRRAGQPAGFLDEAGVAFAAPAELYGGPGTAAPEGTGRSPLAGGGPESLPVVEVGGAGAEQLKGLPAVLEVLARDSDLPVPAAQMAFRSAYEGWEVRLQDGTQVLWGDLRWTREKLSRLHEVLSDARAGALGSAVPGGRLFSAPGGGGAAAAAPMLADLRYFEDGRVLLSPVMGNRTPTR